MRFVIFNRDTCDQFFLVKNAENAEAAWMAASITATQNKQELGDYPPEPGDEFDIIEETGFHRLWTEVDARHIKATTKEEKTRYGSAWCEGRDPADGGWVFDDGGKVDGDEICQCVDRQTAEDYGVPAVILDMFEESGGNYTEPGNDLFTWLQDNSHLFRS
jgi:hypothetical protein